MLALLASAATLATPALAHAGGHESGGSDSHEIAVLLLALGGALVVAGLALDRYRDLPRQYVDGLVVGGAAVVLLLAPLFWFF